MKLKKNPTQATTKFQRQQFMLGPTSFSSFSLSSFPHEKGMKNKLKKMEL
jgi:hypothetical protein